MQPFGHVAAVTLDAPREHIADAIQHLRTSTHAFAYAIDESVRLEVSDMPTRSWFRCELELSEWRSIARQVGFDPSLPYASEPLTVETPLGERLKGFVAISVYLRFHDLPDGFERARMRVGVRSASNYASYSFEGNDLVPFRDRWVLHQDVDRLSANERAWNVSLGYQRDLITTYVSEAIQIKKADPDGLQLDVAAQTRQLPQVHRTPEHESYSGLLVYEFDVCFRS